MPFPYYELEYTRGGRLYRDGQADEILRHAHDFSDLLVLCGGWCGDHDAARKWYGKLSDNMSTVLGLDLVPRLRGRKFAAVRLFWPWRRYTEEDSLPAHGTAGADQQSDAALSRLLEEMQRNPVSLDGKETDPVRAAALQYARALVPRVDTEPDARREFVLALRTILNPAYAHPDDGSLELFAREPDELFSLLGAPFAFTVAQAERAADAQPAIPQISDLQNDSKAAARRVASYAAYYELKERACTVGEVGLAALLQRLRDENDALRVHLVGHSFGALLALAAAELQHPKDGPLTLALLQGACSHHALAQRFDGEHDGAFRRILSERRISGPVIATHTQHDAAVGIAYPPASRIARKQEAALGAGGDPYAGMGRSGALHTPEAVDGRLFDIGQAYRFAPGKVYNLNADRFVKSHADVCGPEIAYAILNAASAV